MGFADSSGERGEERRRGGGGGGLCKTRTGGGSGLKGGLADGRCAVPLALVPEAVDPLAGGWGDGPSGVACGGPRDTPPAAVDMPPAPGGTGRPWDRRPGGPTRRALMLWTHRLC